MFNTIAGMLLTFEFKIDIFRMWLTNFSLTHLINEARSIAFVSYSHFYQQL